MSNYNLEKRRYVIAFVATAIVVVYIVRLFTLQLLSDDYKKNADSNAFLKKITSEIGRLNIRRAEPSTTATDVCLCTTSRRTTSWW